MQCPMDWIFQSNDGNDIHDSPGKTEQSEPRFSIVVDGVDGGDGGGGGGGGGGSSKTPMGTMFDSVSSPLHTHNPHSILSLQTQIQTLEQQNQQAQVFQLILVPFCVLYGGC